MMNKQAISPLSFLPLITAGALLSSPIAAQAGTIGSLASPVGVNSNIYEFADQVQIKISGDLASFTFANPYQVTYANGAFDSFGGSQGEISDIAFDYPEILTTPVSLASGFEFLKLDADDSFFLTKVYSPTFTPSGSGTVVSFAIKGYFNTPSLEGTGIISANFSRLTPAQVIGLASSSSGLTASYLGSIEAVPEPITILGVGSALGFGVLFKRKQAKK